MKAGVGHFWANLASFSLELEVIQLARVLHHVIEPSRGRVCHYKVLLFIWTCSITATIVCIFEPVQWRWAFNVSTACG
jgi:hypothetical protein